MTTAHKADDVRIFERECRSLASTGLYDVYILGSGFIPRESPVTLINLRERPKSRIGRFTKGPLGAWEFARTNKFDIWHFHDPETLPVAIWLARRGNAVIWDAHEDYEIQISASGAKSWVPAPLRGVIKKFMSVLLRGTDKSVAAVIAATPTIANRYQNPLTTLVGNEVRTSDFEHCAPSFDSKQVLFTGSVSQGHCFPQVVEAVASLPGVRLLVAGRDPDPDTWSQAKSIIGSRLSHAGWLDRNGIVDAINVSSIGLVTYANSEAYSDELACPTKLFEFAAAGLPIVATPNPPIRRLLNVAKSGYLAESNTVESLSHAINRALLHPGKWHEWSRQGRSWAQDHGSWSGSEARLLNLYATLSREL